MSYSQVDRKTLSWIKESVDETLKSVHDAPDAYLQNLDDPSPIEICIAPLKRVKGAMDMVGIRGAAMLAEELAILAQALLEGKVKQKNDAAEVLATGILQLPGYLESLYHGQPDIPLILLPLLNDLRACQDKELLTEGEFFSPNLSINAPVQAVEECIVNGDIRTVAKKLRPGYLSGLLGIIKEENLEENLSNLKLVLENLLIASNSDKAKQLWWITLGIVDSLADDTLDASIAVKILLGRVDRQIQQLIAHGEDVISLDPPDKVIKNLLYYIAQSNSYSDSVIELKKSFGLDYPDDNLVQKARENLYGFNVNLIESISEQVKEELTSIKDALDIAMHAQHGSAAGLAGVLDKFGTVADTLGMLGMNNQRNILLEQQEFLKPRVEAEETLGEEHFMSIASTLLNIESSLSNLNNNFQMHDDERIVSPTEFAKVLKLTATEIIADIQHAKESIGDYSKEPTRIELLVKVPELLTNVTGAMKILLHDQLANLTQAINDYISQELIGNNIEVSEISLDLLADAIMGVENYYQSILEQSVAPEIGLNVASRSIARLGFAPKGSQFENSNFSSTGSSSFSMAG